MIYVLLRMLLSILPAAVAGQLTLVLKSFKVKKLFELRAEFTNSASILF
jgi:hypothetical protein